MARRPAPGRPPWVPAWSQGCRTVTDKLEKDSQWAGGLDSLHTWPRQPGRVPYMSGTWKSQNKPRSILQKGSEWTADTLLYLLIPHSLSRNEKKEKAGGVPFLNGLSAGFHLWRNPRSPGATGHSRDACSCRIRDPNKNIRFCALQQWEAVWKLSMF